MQVLKKVRVPEDEENRTRNEVKVYWQSQSRYHVLVFGVTGSPYTRKVISALRYLRIPSATVVRGSPSDVGFPAPPGPPLLPNVVFVKDWMPMADSSLIIREVEKRSLHETGRSLYPSRHSLAFLAALLEDFADEWMTKPMFHFRWHHERDSKKAGVMLPSWSGESFLSLNEHDLVEVSTLISDRQISRLGVVGSSSKTKDIIEDSYKEFLLCFNAHLEAGFPFLFGNRPSIADFAIFGQLTQLVSIDPTSTRICEEIAPRVIAWVGVMEDLSGKTVVEGQWQVTNYIPPTLHSLLTQVVGNYYVPYMLANHAAFLAKSNVVSFHDHRNREWTSEPFKYQSKCLGWLRQGYSELNAEARREVDGMLAGTGCLALFEATNPRL